MRRFHKIASVLSIILLAGCAIEPTPDQTTGSYTYQIANHIRCEAQRAIMQQAINLLRSYNEDKIADRLESKNPYDFKLARKQLKNLDKTLQVTFNLYKNIAIAYQFTMNISEQNVNRLEINFLGPFTGGSGTLGLGGGLDRSRQNIRIFTITDTFGELVEDNAVCENFKDHIDYVYPMSGSIGVADAINNFVDLNVLRSASGHEILSPDEHGGAEVYSTTFAFTTIVDLTFNPGGTNNPSIFGPKDGLLSNSAKRTDIHQVIVGFSLPSSRDANVSTGIGASFYGRNPAAAGVARNSTPGQRARQAIENSKVDFFLQNFNLLAPR